MLIVPRRVIYKMPFCALLQRYGPVLHRSRPGQPAIMDLSSLDGPPILDRSNTVHDIPQASGSTPIDFSSLDGPPAAAPNANANDLLSPETVVPAAGQRLSQPDSYSHYYIFSKPLPPRPASADSSQPSQEPRCGRKKSRLHLDADESTSQNASHLRRSPARRGRVSPNEEILIMEEFLNGDNASTSSSHSRSNSNSTPIPNPNPNSNSQEADEASTEESDLVAPMAAPTPKRAHTCDPLVWMEEEGLWEVPHRWPSRVTLPTSARSLSRSSMSTAFSAIPDGWFHQAGLPAVTSDTVRVHIDSALGESPPSYDSHAFSPTYVMRMQDGPFPGWASVSRCVRNVSAS